MQTKANLINFRLAFVLARFSSSREFHATSAAKYLLESLRIFLKRILNQKIE